MTLDDRLALEALVYRWCEYLDQCRYAELPSLFTDDGHYVFEGSWDERGRDALEARYRARAPGDRLSRHCTTNVRFDADSETEVRGIGIITVYHHVGPGPGSTLPKSIQDFRDRYRREPDGTWRFAERLLNEVFVQNVASTGSDGT